MRKKTKLVYGVGVNDADYPVHEGHLVNGKWKNTWTCPFYSKWKCMLQRCYNEKTQKRQPTYLICHTTPEWHYFMSFRSWMVQQDWEGKHLDKDILFPGNKIYSPETCVFIDQKVNSFLIESAASRGQWPVGVVFDKEKGKFKSQCWSVQNGKLKHLGYFDTPNEAHENWLTFKVKQAHILAAEQTDPRVAAALIDRYENYAKYFPQPT